MSAIPEAALQNTDRNGNRYDQFAADPKNGIIPGGTNNLDGDYFESKWAESGVLEADCLICHLKSYDMEKRNAQVKEFNFRWAATAGAGFGKVEGSILKGETPKVIYNPSMFQEGGKVVLPVIREVQNGNCLFCHHGSDWKKRGSSYSHRTDVHIRAGLRCIDCHLTGRHAEDPRIYGREEHQIGKGDDPGDFDRDDLDNTMRSCEDCHANGILNAPVPQHKGFPPVHFEKIACQTCHIPWRQVRAALVQDSSVFNASPRIEPPGKRIWNFYGPDITPWNYYGFEIGYPEGLQPFFKYRPALGKYKDKIYPLNRVYTLWTGIKTKGEKGINQPFMKDIFMMWKNHSEHPDTTYPELSIISDDNRDGFPEVNRPEEIKSLLSSVTSMLKQKGVSMKNKTVVFVDGDRYTADGNKWISLPKKPYEYSPYGSVFKYSHDITPARNALGAKGCADCHALKSTFFEQPVMTQPFDENGKPTYRPNAELLGFSSTAVFASGFRQEILKPILFFSILAGILLLLIMLVCGDWVIGLSKSKPFPWTPTQRLMLGILGVGLLGPSIIVIFESLLPSNVIGILENIHRWAGVGLVIATLWLMLKTRGKNTDSLFWTGIFLVAFMTSTGVFLWVSSSENIRQILYTLHDAGAICAGFIALVSIIYFFLHNRAAK